MRKEEHLNETAYHHWKKSGGTLDRKTASGWKTPNLCNHKDLNLTPVDDPDENLRALANRHAELSGSYVNWLATYQHAEQVWRKGFERRKKAMHG